MSLLIMILLVALLIYQLITKTKRNDCPKVTRTNTPSVPLISSFSPPPVTLTLTAVVLVRFFEKDNLRFTQEHDLTQWLDYMRYAGVQHFYVYDNCHADIECLEATILDNDDITYIRWSVLKYTEAQTPAYNHHLQTHFPQAKYEVLLDIDEYPFMPNNNSMNPNFLRDYAMTRQSPQVLMRSMFFGGEATSGNDWRALRYTKRRPQAEPEGRTKPLYQPSHVNYHGPTNLHEMLLWHNNDALLQAPFKYSPYDLIMGHDKMEDAQVLRLNHYWCERLSESDEEEQLVYDDSMVQVIARVNEWKKNQKKGVVQ